MVSRLQEKVVQLQPLRQQVSLSLTPKIQSFDRTLPTPVQLPHMCNGLCKT